MSELVHYNYAAMTAVAEGIGMVGHQLSGLLAAAQANEATMLGHFHGAAAGTAQMCLQKYKQAQTDMIEIIVRGRAAYDESVASMNAAEMQQSAAFPG